MNGDTNKAIGVLAVAAISASSFLGAIPLLGAAAGVVYATTWIYGVADGYLVGKAK